MKPDEFEKAVKRGDISPLYYVYGDEPYLVERGAKLLLESVVSPDFRDFNLFSLGYRHHFFDLTVDG